MAKNIIESIFNFKNQLDMAYPRLFGVKTFDLEQKHLVYGKVNRQGDAIYLDDSVLEPVAGIRTHWVPDFVKDAFLDFKTRYKTASNSNIIDRNSLYQASLKVHKAWEYGDLNFRYNSYINNLYTNFVGEYLSLNRRHERIKNFKDFVKEFIRYCLRIAYYFPLTKTGYILSAHCSPFAGGLMLEIAPKQHGLQHKDNIIRYINDPNFVFFVNEAKKFGFMVDKNAPWRIVFNIFSGMLDFRSNGSLTGGQKYMDRYATGVASIFQYYYRKAHLEEMLNIQNIMLSLYESFYLQYSTYETVKSITDETGRCNQTVPRSVRKDRELPPTLDADGQSKLPFLGPQKEVDEYWLKIVLKLRMVETRYPHNNYNFNFYIKEAIARYRLSGTASALNYINDLTKGDYVTKFLRKGEYWYGISQAEYDQRKRQAKEDAIDPPRVDRVLTGTKNIK